MHAILSGRIFALYTYVADFVIGKENLKVHFSNLHINRCIVE